MDVYDHRLGQEVTDMGTSAYDVVVTVTIYRDRLGYGYWIEHPEGVHDISNAAATIPAAADMAAKDLAEYEADAPLDSTRRGIQER